MTHRCRIVILLTLLITGLDGQDSGTNDTKRIKIFDGKPKTLAFFTSSHGGNKQLHKRIKRMPGGEHITFKSMRIKFYDKKNDRPSWAPREMITTDEPVIYLVLGGATSGAVRWEGAKRDFVGLPPRSGEYDREQALAMYQAMLNHAVKCVTAKGVDLLFLSDLHYSPVPQVDPFYMGWDHSAEVVRRHNATPLGQQHPAIDIRTATKALYPYHLQFDMYHPSRAGIELMAHLWFEALCKWDGIEVPAWSHDWFKVAWNAELAQRSIINSVRVSGLPDEHTDGVAKPHVAITWQCDPAKVPAVDILACGPCCYDYAIIASNVAVPANGRGTFIWQDLSATHRKDHTPLRIAMAGKNGPGLKRIMIRDSRKKSAAWCASALFTMKHEQNKTVVAMRDAVDAAVSFENVRQDEKTPVGSSKEGPPQGSPHQVKAILTKVSQARTPEQIAPYRHAFVVVQYRVQQSKSPQFKVGDTITVVHWSVKDRKALPPSFFKPDVVHGLTLIPYKDHPQASTSAVDDDIVDLFNPLWYAQEYR